ncbi:hypothetical protein [Haloarchaeobius sp. HRN-SO-5]|uniref:hypothetical protein n=1 Tax=Haloarchaeobius sp. HRN-SO-5 TaxID=3446118 RepID=UPI003EB7190B
MSQERERQGDERVVADAVVLATFDSLAPRTATEVAEQTDVGREVAATVLDDLVDAGELDSKDLVDESDALRAYYLPAAHAGDGHGPEAAREAAVQEAIAEMDVPGVSEMMQDWRRDALERAWEYLAENGTVSDREFKREVFPPHKAGYDTVEGWWSFVEPRLAQLPGVAGPGEAGTTWEYVAP